MAERAADLLPLGAVIAGEEIFLTWAPIKQTVAYARAIATEVRRRGGTLTGCTLDAQVKRGHECPVCGQKGLA
jgi:hypothetical protein